ncbi:ferredoxin--NADP reductase [Gordonia sp. HY002]|uniref:ferredoxin--NADP reductase n=1 Tax=Gordonia zhenghanii TaxID=2911516 RepID=UPI001EF00F3D|nr:ferredoxin--NADP reductase [Gordonia zhenghanii]MCF8568776.1 ferredoxin--NADP reductase [Gordonia zhenghanii]MCF8606109.1 ferredoxin--NADP reductase [Gordonia zhenghanii]
MAVIDETPDARSIVLRPTEVDRPTFAYDPGQFLTIAIPSELTGHVARSYSLSSAPSLDADLKITVKRISSGYGSNWLCDNVQTGALVTVLPPAGRFTPTSYDVDVLLFAAGSGITPVMSILKAILANGAGAVTLFYANRDADSVIFARELNGLRDAHRGRLTVIHWFDGVSGFPTTSHLIEVIDADTSREVFVCGPGPFMDAVAAAVEAARVPRERFHREVFSSITGDPFTPTPVPVNMLEPGGSSGVETSVLLYGLTHNFEWSTDLTLVDALLARDVAVPYSCRSGECGSCVCRVTKGAVTTDAGDVLEPEDAAEGYVLGCQSRPSEGPIEIEF